MSTQLKIVRIDNLETRVRTKPRPIHRSMAARYEEIANRLSKKVTLPDSSPSSSFAYRCFGAPSFLLRLDMADGLNLNSVLEMEFGPSGLGIAQAVGATDVLSSLAERLRECGISEIAALCEPGRISELSEQRIAHDAFRRHGINVCSAESPNHIPSNCPVWLHGDPGSYRSAEAGLISRSLFGHYPEPVVRLALRGENRAELLSKFDLIDQLHGRFQGDGYVVKPLNGRNGKGILYWLTTSTGSRNAEHRRATNALLLQGMGSNYLVQPLYRAGLRRVKSLFFVASPDGYRFAGGFAMKSKKPIVRVGPHTVVEPLINV